MLKRLSVYILIKREEYVRIEEFLASGLKREVKLKLTKGLKKE